MPVVVVTVGGPGAKEPAEPDDEDEEEAVTKLIPITQLTCSVWREGGSE